MTTVLDALEPWHTGRGYSNFAETHPAHPATLYPPAIHQRLTHIKATIDPDNLFQANHPIQPSVR